MRKSIIRENFSTRYITYPKFPSYRFQFASAYLPIIILYARVLRYYHTRVYFLQYLLFRFAHVTYIVCVHVTAVQTRFILASRGIKSLGRRNRPVFRSFCTLGTIDVFASIGVRSRTIYTSSISGAISSLFENCCISMPRCNARADAGFDPRIVAACFAYVTSSILLGIRRYAGASWNPKPANFGYEAFCTSGFRAMASPARKYVTSKFTCRGL